MSKKIFCLTLVFLVSVACGKKTATTKKSGEIVLWSELLSPSTSTYVERKDAFDKYIINNPLSFPVSPDVGPALYRERSQRYFLQGKSGTPNLLEGTLEQVYSYIASGMALPIEDMFNMDAEKTIFYPNLLKALTVNGHLYGFPNAANVRLLVYRKDLLEKYSLNVPKTWSDLVTVATILHEKESINGFMFTTQTQEVRAFQEFMSFYFTLADSIFSIENNNATYVAKIEHLEQVLTLYKDLFNLAIDPNAKSQDWKAVDYGITGGQTAMVTVGPWIWEHLNEEPARESVMTNLAVTTIPIPYNGGLGTYMEVKGLVFNPYADENKRNATYEVVKALVSKEVIQMDANTSGIPIRSDVQSPVPFFQSFADNLESGKVLEFVNWEIPQNYIIDAIQNVIYSKLTPNEAANMLAKQLEEYAPNAIPKD